MTTKQTLKELAAAGKAVSLQQLYRYFNQIGISPSGANQRPQQYPADTARRVLAHLGFAEAVTTERAELPPVNTAAAIIGVRPLLKIRKQAKRGRATK